MLDLALFVSSGDCCCWLGALVRTSMVVAAMPGTDLS